MAYLGALDNAYNTYTRKVAASRARAAEKLSLASVQNAIKGVVAEMKEAGQALMNGTQPNGHSEAAEEDVGEKGIGQFDFVCLHR